MKSTIINLLSFTFIVLIIASCGGDDNPQLRGVTKEERAIIARDSANYTYIKWLETTINFGTILSGDKIRLIYRFKNVGEKPLFIISVSESCNCAVAEYNTDPVQPGKQGTISVVFDSKTQEEAVRKSLTVETNTFNNRFQYLIFAGRVRDCCGANADKNDDVDNPYTNE